MKEHLAELMAILGIVLVTVFAVWILKPEAKDIALAAVTGLVGFLGGKYAKSQASGRATNGSGKPPLASFLVSLLPALIFSIVFMSGLSKAYAVTQVVPANQVTMGWDAPTVDAQGNPLPAEIQLQYRLYYVSMYDTAKASALVVGTTTRLDFVFTFSGYGTFILGVKAEQIVEGTVVAESVVAWSDVPERCKDGKTFAVVRVIGPSMAGGLNLKQ